ncbi:MAG: phosphodiesterase [Clostridia bacterium]|nr:phosphodiesterase [Clostridia bacterium]
MKFLIASDIHGSAYYTEKVLERAKAENADKIILLGDIFNHGPRNPLPKEYAPLKVADLLNTVKNDLIVIKGNCDSEVDTLISEFDFIPHMMLMVANKTVFLTHGHVYNKDNMPKVRVDAIIYGHFHTGFIENVGKYYVANAGSVALPKNGTPSSYIIISDEEFSLKDIDGNLIKSVKL